VYTQPFSGNAPDNDPVRGGPTIPIQCSSQVVRSYVATNAFNRRVRVYEYADTVVALVLPSANFLSDHRPLLAATVPIGQAPLVKPRLRVLAVATTASFQNMFAHERQDTEHPTIDWPFSRHVTYRYVYATDVRLWLYDFATGRVIARLPVTRACAADSLWSNCRPQYPPAGVARSDSQVRPAQRVVDSPTHSPKPSGAPTTPRAPDCFRGSGRWVVAKLLDSVTESPIPGAYLSIEGSACQAAADSTGQFRLFTPLGRHTVLVRSMGRPPTALQIDVGNNTTDTSLVLYLSNR
jgi:hypothetical protein